jgi:hypothetical protein
MKTSSAQFLISTETDSKLAVKEIRSQLSIEHLEGLLFFCGSSYDLDGLSNELESYFDCEIIGCTTAGEIAGNYYNNSLVVLALSYHCFVLHTGFVKDVNHFNLSQAMQLSLEIESKLQLSNHYSDETAFGFLMTDGLSLKEELVISSLSHAFGDISILGGSAGDDLKFKRTFVYHNGKFHSNSAVLAVIEVVNDFEIFKMQHFVPTNKELVTTKVNFEKRIVEEINGRAAAVVYAEINGLDIETMTDTDFAMNPLMLNIANDWYIRSIANVTHNQSLQFYCSIDYGLPLNIAAGIDIVERLEQEVERIEKQFEQIDFTLGCDCIHRRLEIFQKGYQERITDLLKRINFFGFNSYGEQFNGIHFNQTLVGVVVGKKRNE